MNRRDVEPMPGPSDASSELTAPAAWPWALQSPPIASSDACGWRTGLMRRWSGTSPVMVQPPLDHHYVVIHLGGAKQVKRMREGRPITAIAEPNALTLVPAGNAYVWHTQGPIAFAHLYIKPQQLEQTLVEDHDIDGRSVSMVDGVGCRDRILEPLLSVMLAELRNASHASTLRLDGLFAGVCSQLAHRHTSRSPSASVKVVALAPHRLRRVLEFMEANLGSDLSLADLAAAAGSGQAHFSHAFRIATGCSPYRYLVRRRVALGKVLLMTTDLSLDAIGRACGFSHTVQFATMFKRAIGVGPKRFRIAFRKS